jgi:hypothetical protein
MNIPPDLMNLVNGSTKGGPAAQAMPEQGEGPTSNSPVSSPMSTPEPKQGDKQHAMISVSLAQDLLEQTLPAIGSETEEGGVILDVLKMLNKKFGESARKAKELVPAEMMHLMQNLPQFGGMSPEMKALMQGGAGGGAPPGGAQKSPMPAMPAPPTMQ